MYFRGRECLKEGREEEICHVSWQAGSVAGSKNERKKPVLCLCETRNADGERTNRERFIISLDGAGSATSSKAEREGSAMCLGGARSTAEVDVKKEGSALSLASEGSADEANGEREGPVLCLG